MTPKTNELSKEECAAIAAHLDACITILDRNVGHRPVPQIKLRSMLAVLRGELLNSGLNEITLPPFSYSPPEKR